MTTTEATISGDDRNFTINFGPQTRIALFKFALSSMALLGFSVSAQAQTGDQSYRATPTYSALVQNLAAKLSATSVEFSRDCVLASTMTKNMAGNRGQVGLEKAAGTGQTLWLDVYNRASGAGLTNPLTISQIGSAFVASVNDEKYPIEDRMSYIQQSFAFCDQLVNEEISKLEAQAGTR